MLRTSVLLSLASAAIAVNNCTSNIITCPATGNFNVCSGDSLSSNIIIRCADGCPQPGNCNDNLAGEPPVGVKTAAKCYQDSATAGNAQCTFDCVLVTKLDGSSFYPLGCSSSSSSGSASSTSGSATSMSTSASSTGGGGSGGSKTTSSTGPTTTGGGGSNGGGSGGGNGGGSGGNGGGVTSSTTYYTTTLPGGSVSTGSSVVVIATGAPPALSNDAGIVDARGMAVLGVAGLLALV